MNRTQHRRASGEIAFRGKPLSQRQLEWLRALVEGGPRQSRQALAREACQRFRWRRENGTLAVRSALDLLARLEQAGVLRLPAPRRAQGRPCREKIATAARALCEDDGRDRVRVVGPGTRLVVRPLALGELPSWRAHMERYHYLGDAPLVGESLRYMAELDGERVALLSWGAATLRNGPRDRFLGWSDAARRANLARVVNNARFLVLPCGRRAHLASRVLGANLRRLSRDWQEVYGHPVVLAETFVDTSRFRGTCYRASNWMCVGETQGWSKSGLNYRFHGHRKVVWLYPLSKDFRERLVRVTEWRPQRGAFMGLDLDRLPLEGDGGLFDILRAVPDPRMRRGIRHQIQSVLATALCGVLAGARSFTAMAEWAAEQSPQTLKRLGSRLGRPPSDRTLRRLFASIDVEDLDRRTGAWIAGQLELRAGTGLAIDGKTMRGSGDGDQPQVHLLSAIVHGSGAVVAQTRVESKTNEITKVGALLADQDIEGLVVTADALLTQREIARHIVEDKGADYLLAVKDNQPRLKKDIEFLFSTKEQEARRGSLARQEPPEREAFPPSAPNR